MTLTPQDVEQQVFRERRRGYDPEEVDRFLDEVANSLGELMRQRDRASKQATELQQSSEGARESETLLRRTLLTAERTAEQTVGAAQEEADKLLDEARREAAEMVHSAEAEAAQMRRSAEQEAAKMRFEAEREAAELRSSLESEIARERDFARVGADRVRRAIVELQSFRDEYRERVQGVIADQLAALDRVGDLPEIDPAIERVAHSKLEGESAERSRQ